MDFLFPVNLEWFQGIEYSAGWIIPLLLYVIISYIQYNSNANRVSRLQLRSTFPFPPEVKQLGNDFQTIEQSLLTSDETIILSEHHENAKDSLEKRLTCLCRRGLIIISKSLRSTLSLDGISGAVPDGVAWEVLCVSPDKPVLVLAVGKDWDPKSVGEYILGISRKVALKLRLFTDEHLSVLDGTLEDDCFESQDAFDTKVSQIVEDGRRYCNPHSLIMHEQKCLKIRRAVLISATTTTIRLTPCDPQSNALWVLKPKNFNIVRHALGMQGNVTTCLGNLDNNIVVAEVARRWEKTEPTLLCMDGFYRHVFREQGIVSQVISPGEIRSAQIKKGITRLMAKDIGLKDIETLKRKLPLSRALVFNPLMVSKSAVIVSTNESWSPMLLDRLSRDFKKMEERISQKIKFLTENTSYKDSLQVIKVAFFSKGSVRAKVSLHYTRKDLPKHLTPRRQEDQIVGKIITASRRQNKKTDLMLHACPVTESKIDKSDYLPAFKRGEVKRCVQVLESKGDASCPTIHHLLSDVPNWLSVHDYYNGGNILYWSVVLGREDVTQELLPELQMDSEIVFETLLFCMSQRETDAAMMIIAHVKKRNETTERQIDLDYSVPDAKRTLLMQAGELGKHEVVEALLLAGAKPEATDNKNQTVLHLACEKGHTKVIEVLLRKTFKVNVNTLQCSGMTPIMIAALYGHSESFFLIVNDSEHNVYYHGRDEDQRNILHLASLGGSTKIVRHLLKIDRAKIKERSKQGLTPLMVAVQADNVDVFQTLVSEEDINDVDGEGNKLIHIAALHGSRFVIENLIQQDVDIGATNRAGFSALMIAAKNGDFEVFEILQRHQAKLEGIIDGCQNTLLHLACQGGNVQIVNELLPVYSITSAGDDNLTPVQMAKKYKNVQVVDWLKWKSCDEI